MKPASAPARIISQSLIDDFGDVSKLRDEFAPTERLYQKLRAELAGIVADAPAATEFVECGRRFTLDITARKMERKVDMAAARKKLGVARFMEVCSVTLSALSNLLAKPEVEALTYTEQTGSRTFTTTPV